MRVAAERVDAQMVDYMRAHAIAGPWPTQDRLLVCVNESPVAKKLVRTAKRMADRARMPWIAVNVHTPEHDALRRRRQGPRSRRRSGWPRAWAARRSRCTPNPTSPASSSRSRARATSRRILLGRPRRRRWSGWLREHVTDRLLRQAGQFEITVVAPEDEAAPGQVIEASAAGSRLELRAFGWATLAVAIAIAVAHRRSIASCRLPNLSLIFLMAVLLVAIRFGLWPSVYTSLAELPRLQLLLHRALPHLHRRAPQEDVLTVVFFLVVAVIVGNLAARLKAQVEAMRQITPAHRQPLRLQPQDRGRRGARRRALGGGPPRRVDACSATRSCCCRGRASSRSPPATRPRTRCRRPPGAPRAGPGSTASRPAGARTRCRRSEWLFLPLETGRGAVGLLGVSFENRGAAADAGAAPAAGSAGRPGRGRDRAHQPRDRHRGGAPADRDRAAALGAALVGLARPAHAPGLDHRLGHQPRELRRRALARGPRAAPADHPRGERAAQPLRAEPARHDPARLRRAAAEPRMGRSARDRRPGAQQLARGARRLERRGGDPGRPAAAPRRPDADRAGAGQHSRQRRQILAGRRRGSRSRRSSEGERVSVRVSDEGPGIPAGSARDRVRRVLSRARRRQAGRRHRPRPVDLPRPDRGPWRPDRGAARAGRTRHDDRVLAAGASGARDRRRRRRGRAPSRTEARRR